MRDPLGWSFPLGRIFGIMIRVHWLFPVVSVGLILRHSFAKDAVAGQWIDLVWIQIILFVSVLLHEFGHCFAARYMDGEANEVLMWPLGGLAYVDVPHTPRANLVTVLGGPAVNILFCIISALVLIFLLDPGFVPPWELWYTPMRSSDGAMYIRTLDGMPKDCSELPLVVLTARIFWVNLFLAAFNLLLIGYPMDSGRILQCLLWPYVGYRQATLVSVFAGFVVMLIVGCAGIVANEALWLALAAFIYFSCKHQWILLESGGEDSLLGYDFSQGYTSLEREDVPAPPRKKQSWFARWQQRRAARRLQQEQEQRQAEEGRMDELLQKVQTHGSNSLTDEKKRFMKRVSDRYRNRS